jgi:hypothetical protein
MKSLWTSTKALSQAHIRRFDLPVLYEGQEKVALVYVDPVTAEGCSTDEYIQRINLGLVDAKLSNAYVTRYVRRYIPARPS